MERDPINWEVEKKDVKEFMEPLNIEINIDKNQYNYIFHEGFINTVKNVETAIVNRIFGGDKDDIQKKALNSKISLSYIPNFKDKNWNIQYSPIQIYNSIYEIVNLDKRLDNIDYSNEKVVLRTKNQIKLDLIEKREILSANNAEQSKINFIQEAINGVDNIFLLKDFDIESRIEHGFKYKDLLFYLAVTSLFCLDETGDLNFAKFAKKYYKEVSSKEKPAEYPHTLHMNEDKEHFNYDSFNRYFCKELVEYPCLLDRTLNLDSVRIMDRLEIVKSDNFVDKLDEFYDDYFGVITGVKTRNKKTKTKDEINQMLREKISFYQNLVNLSDSNNEKLVVGVVKGKIDLYGYYGFVLRNNYIVLDKFFKIDNNLEISPSSDEALYSMPLNIFVELDGSKKKMMKYRKQHPDGYLNRNYHTKNLSYQQKVLKTAMEEDVSTMKNDWFLSIFAPHEEKLKK